MPSQITLPSIQSRRDDTVSLRRTDVLCRSCTCSEDPRPIEHAVVGYGISHPAASLDTFSMLVDPPDQSIKVEATSYSDTKGIGAFEPFLVPIGPEMDLLSLINISGRLEFQQRIAPCVRNLRDCFSIQWVVPQPILSLRWIQRSGRLELIAIPHGNYALKSRLKIGNRSRNCWMQA